MAVFRRPLLYFAPLLAFPALFVGLPRKILPPSLASVVAPVSIAAESLAASGFDRKAAVSRNRPPSRAYSTMTGAATSDQAHPTGAVVVYVTVPSMEVAKTLANSLLEKYLAACVNIVPGLTSLYRWEGKVNEDSELLLMIKSRQSLVPELTLHVQKHHPYDECEVISVPITGGSATYLQWIVDSTLPSDA